MRAPELLIELTGWPAAQQQADRVAQMKRSRSQGEACRRRLQWGQLASVAPEREAYPGTAFSIDPVDRPFLFSGGRLANDDGDTMHRTLLAQSEYVTVQKLK